MFFAAALALGMAQPATPATPEQEVRIHSVLSAAVQKMAVSTSCSMMPKPRPSDWLAVIGAYEGDYVPTVTVAGQDEDTSLADIVVKPGSGPIYLVLTSYDPLIWRVSGDTARVRQLTVFHQNGAGVLGISAAKISFIKDEHCRLPYDIYGERRVETDVPILSIFGRRANVIGGNYDLFRAILDGSSLTIDRVPDSANADVIVDATAEPTFPVGKGNGPSSLEKEFLLRFPAGIASVDPQAVVATGNVERYETLPKTAGALQLEQSGAIIPATSADVRRWKDRAVMDGHVRADRINNLEFYNAYRVTRPIRLPAGLCGGYMMTFFVPSRDFVRGDPCHSNIYVDDGTIMAGSAGD